MTEYLEQQPFAMAEFADNPEPRCPCVLLLDTSASMEGDPIGSLNQAIQAFREDLMGDSLACKRVEVAIITFGPVEVVQEFGPVEGLSISTFHASGNTPLGAAIETGLQLLKDRKSVLRGAGIQLFRPWVFLITDGAPTDNWRHIPELISEGERNQSFAFFSLGVTGADFDTLRAIGVREAMPLRGLEFTEFFMWLSASLKSVSQSNPGDTVSLPDYKPYGWAEV